MTGRYVLTAIFGVVLLLMMAFFFWGIDATYPWPYAWAVMVPYVYFALWVRFHPVGQRRKNVWLGLIYLIVWGLVIEGIFASSGFSMLLEPDGVVMETHQGPHYHGACLCIGYGIMCAALLVFALIMGFTHMLVYYNMNPRYKHKVTMDDVREYAEEHPSHLVDSAKAAYMLDKALNRKKPHDHSLGSYYADHDDEGNYDPGAWRRKYDVRR